MKIKVELKRFDNEITAKVESRDENDINFSVFNKNDIGNKRKYWDKSQKKRTNLELTSSYLHILIASFLWR